MSRARSGRLSAIVAVWIAVAPTVLILTPERASARSKKLSLRLDLANEAANLRHPSANYADGGGTWIYIPRFAAGVGFDIRDWLTLSVGTEVSVPTNLVARHVSYQAADGDLYAQYFGLAIPVTATSRSLQGVDWALGWKVAIGPSFERWTDSALLNSAGERLPLKITSDWHVGGFARIGAVAEGHLFEWLTVMVGPYAGTSTNLEYALGFTAQVIVK